MREAAGGFRDRLELRLSPSRSAASRRRAKPSAWASISTTPAADSQREPEDRGRALPQQLEGVPQAEAAAWVELSRVLLNLDEFITRE